MIKHYVFWDKETGASLVVLDDLKDSVDKVKQLSLNGTNVSERMPLIVGIGDENREYMAIKVDKMGHDIPDGELNS